MKIELVTPAPLRLTNGNKITALRWKRILSDLGHRVDVTQKYSGSDCDLLIALHARRSAESISAFHCLHPDRPLILVLTGTDLYRDIRTRQKAKQSLELAWRIVALQRQALEEISRDLRTKTRIIYQSAEGCARPDVKTANGVFRVSVIGHLRKEKDPLRTAMAARRLPSESNIVVTQIGTALEARYEQRARAEAARNHRYRWLGNLPHARTRELLARSHVTVISSRIEGSSNVLSEALASGVPVIAARIPGLVGTLGNDYCGFFPVGNTRQLVNLLRRAETDQRFYRDL